MKITDDYRAKYRLWAENPTVASLPVAPALPSFRPQKFRSHAEMNEWKQALLCQLAASGSGHG